MSLVANVPQLPAVVYRVADALSAASRHPGLAVAAALPEPEALPARGDARRARAEVRQAANDFDAGRNEVRRRTALRREIAERDLAARADAAAAGVTRPEAELPPHDAALVELAEEVTVLSNVLDRKVAVWETVVRDEHAAIQRHVERRLLAARRASTEALQTAREVVLRAEAEKRGVQLLRMDTGPNYAAVARELADLAGKHDLSAERPA